MKVLLYLCVAAAVGLAAASPLRDEKDIQRIKDLIREIKRLDRESGDRTEVSENGGRGGPRPGDENKLGPPFPPPGNNPNEGVGPNPKSEDKQGPLGGNGLNEHLDPNYKSEDKLVPPGGNGPKQNPESTENTEPDDRPYTDEVLSSDEEDTEPIEPNIKLPAKFVDKINNKNKEKEEPKNDMKDDSEKKKDEQPGKDKPKPPTKEEEEEEHSKEQDDKTDSKPDEPKCEKLAALEKKGEAHLSDVRETFDEDKTLLEQLKKSIVASEIEDIKKLLDDGETSEAWKRLDTVKEQISKLANNGINKKDLYCARQRYQIMLKKAFDRREFDDKRVCRHSCKKLKETDSEGTESERQISRFTASVRDYICLSNSIKEALEVLKDEAIDKDELVTISRIHLAAEKFKEIIENLESLKCADKILTAAKENKGEQRNGSEPSTGNNGDDDAKRLLKLLNKRKF